MSGVDRRLGKTMNFGMDFGSGLDFADDFEMNFCQSIVLPKIPSAKKMLSGMHMDMSRLRMLVMRERVSQMKFSEFLRKQARDEQQRNAEIRQRKEMRRRITKEVIALHESMRNDFQPVPKEI